MFFYFIIIIHLSLLWGSARCALTTSVAYRPGQTERQRVLFNLFIVSCTMSFSPSPPSPCQSIKLHVLHVLRNGVTLFALCGHEQSVGQVTVKLSQVRDEVEGLFDERPICVWTAIDSGLYVNGSNVLRNIYNVQWSAYLFWQNVMLNLLIIWAYSMKI